MPDKRTSTATTRRSLLSGLGASVVAALHTAAVSANVEEGMGMTAGDGERARNHEIVRRYADAWIRGDVKALVDSYHDEFTLHYFGHNPLAGDHVGKAAALRTLAEVSRRTNRKLLRIVDVMTGAARSVIIAREAFERDGARAEFERVLVFTTRDGRLHECWIYDADQAAIDRFLR